MRLLIKRTQKPASVSKRGPSAKSFTINENVLDLHENEALGRKRLDYISI